MMRVGYRKEMIGGHGGQRMMRVEYGQWMMVEMIANMMGTDNGDK